MRITFKLIKSIILLISRIYYIEVKNSLKRLKDHDRCESSKGNHSAI